MEHYETFLAAAWFNYSILTGLSSAYYDRHRRKLIQPKWLQAIVTIQNVIFVIAIPVLLIETVQRKIPGKHQQIVSKYLTLLSTFIQPTVALITILMRPIRERLMLDIIRDLLELEDTVFEQMPEEIKRKCSGKVKELNRVVLCKCICMLGFTVVFLVFNGFMITYETKWMYVLSMFMVAYKTNVTLGVTFHPFVAVCHINKRWLYINAAIDHGLANDMPYDQLLPLLLVQMQLKALVERLNSAYKYPLFLLRLMNTMNSITCGYWLVFDIATWDTIKLSGDQVVKMRAAFVMYAFYLGDVYLTDCIAENLIEARRQTNEICAFYTSCRNLPIQTERFCEWFALQRCWRSFGLNIFGVYRINRKQTFALLSFIFLYTIFIVQSDYKHFGEST